MANIAPAPDAQNVSVLEVDLIHIETDRLRLKPKPGGAFDPRFLTFYPICSHLSCDVVGAAGDFEGWFCPCHSAHFETSGRVRKGPAPFNNEIPKDEWVSDMVIKLRRLPLLGIPEADGL